MGLVPDPPTSLIRWSDSVKVAVRRASAAAAVVATAGASTLLVGVAPAAAADVEACGPTGDVVAPGICEQVFTTSGSFTPTADMTTLEVLLVGAGGSGADQSEPNTNGYAAGGGGGQVTLVDFSGASSPVTITVAGSNNVSTTATDGGSFSGTATSGLSPSAGSSTGGASGSGNPGSSGGGGAGGTPAYAIDGGPGVVVSSIAPGGSLFTGDTRCFGGGGAVSNNSGLGIPGCGAGGPVDASTLSAPLANSGGGGGGLTITQSPELRQGAAGVAIVRWNAQPVTVTFDVLGKGVAPASQSVAAGAVPTRPADPTAAGYQFDGWFTDEALTIPATFTEGVTASTTYYAKWSLALAPTGSSPDGMALPLGLAALLAGAGLAFAGLRRRRA